ncbi:MAG: ribonuclease HII [Alphaproteobacteria bacterium]|jgi:ribonuclease HII|nr:ribonuclease HII [Candidatus Jidaibacter sp.]
MQSFEHELKFGELVIGVDEVGRGCLAGPVIAAAVKVDKSIVNFCVNDSKKLSIKKRELIYSALIEHFEYAVGIVDVQEIDSVNILNATKKAMEIAIRSLNPDLSLPIIVDGNTKPFQSDKIHTVIQADALMPSVAAASIIAKVTRDRLMKEKGSLFPHYNWQKNAGYGTKQHIDAILEHGICEHHRHTFLKKIMS